MAGNSSQDGQNPLLIKELGAVLNGTTDAQHEKTEPHAANAARLSSDGGSECSNQDVHRQEEFLREPAQIRPNSIALLFERGGDLKLFWEKIQEHRECFEAASKIVEIGAGDCWATCSVKAIFPDKTVIATEVSSDRMAPAPYWERALRVKLDGIVACPSFAMPFKDGTLDLVFAFQSAHHFFQHRRTFAELRRVLRTGGRALYLHEPGSRPLFYPLARRWMKHKGYGDPEDVLIVPKICTLAEEEGFVTQLHLSPTTTNKHPLAALYFFVLKKLPRLGNVFPCIIDLALTKAD